MSLIRVYEHASLRIDDKERFRQLVRFNELHGNKYYAVGNQKLYFGSYVGVIQVGDMVIEIIPKADDDNSEQASEKWRNALINMLYECGMIKIDSISDADLKIKKSNLIDLFFLKFLKEVEFIVHTDLVKNYRKIEKSINVVKGKILFNKNDSHNVGRKDKLYSRYQVYDKNNMLNKILKTALIILVNSNSKHFLISKAKQLLLRFDSVDEIRPSPDLFQRINLSRNSEKYRDALTIAKLILLNYSPDVHYGKENVLAILFDMNELFEKFIYKRLKREESHFNMTITPQIRKTFWGGRSIRPDIMISIPGNRSIIVDTKWKVINDNYPSIEDLKQMFVYNVHYNCDLSVLFYPNCNNQNYPKEKYETSETLGDFGHSCQLYFSDIFDEKGGVDREFARRFLRSIVTDENLVIV